MHDCSSPITDSYSDTTASLSPAPHALGALFYPRPHAEALKSRQPPLRERGQDDTRAPHETPRHVKWHICRRLPSTPTRPKSINLKKSPSRSLSGNYPDTRQASPPETLEPSCLRVHQVTGAKYSVHSTIQPLSVFLFEVGIRPHMVGDTLLGRPKIRSDFQVTDDIAWRCIRVGFGSVQKTVQTDPCTALPALRLQKIPKTSEAFSLLCELPYRTIRLASTCLWAVAFGSTWRTTKCASKK